MRLSPSPLALFILTGLIAATPATAQVAKIDGRSYVPARSARSKTYDAVIRYAKAKSPAPFAVLFAHSKRGHYRAEFSADRATLTKVVPGAKLVAWSSPFHLPQPVETVTLRRLRHLVVVLVNGRVAVQALDTTLDAGRVLVDVTKGAPRPTKATVSPREPLVFTDDFMVTAEEAKEYRGWEVLAGTWDTKSTREDEKTQQAYIERSSNPFAYQGTPKDGAAALTVTGDATWCSYQAGVSVKCLAGGAAGLAFACEDAKNYWLVRLDCADRFDVARPLRLVRVVDGKRTEVAKTWVRARTERWYALGAEIRHGCVRVQFQGATVLEKYDRSITGGRVGLWASGTEVAFDDVSVRQLQRFSMDFAPAHGGYAAAEADGAWRSAHGGRAPKNGSGRALSGDPSWPGGAATAELRLARKGAVGLIAGAAATQGYALMLRPDGTGSLIAPGPKPRELVTFTHATRPGDWTRVALNLAEKGVVSGYVGDRLVARAKALFEPRGRVGVVFDDAPGAAYRGLVANRSPHLLAEHQVSNAVFLGDAYMTSWATEKGQWIPDDGPDKARSMGGYQFDGRNEFWRKGDYYGNYVMVLPLTVRSPAGEGQPPAHTPIDGRIAVHFEVQSGDLRSGYTVAVRSTGEGVYTVELAFKDESLATAADLEPSGGANELRVYNTDAYLWAKLGGREVFCVRKDRRGAGTRIAATRKGDVDFDRLAVHAENLDDNAFERAPTRWRIVGDWQITNRFKCDPRWSWMGVDSTHGYSALWHTREFPGDVTVELYASMKMRSSRPYYFPSDLNLTISADRELPASGYTVLVGGWKNTRTALLRNGKVVKSTTDRYLPDTRDSYPSSAMLHRRWFYVKLRRTGNRIRLYCDNKLYLDYTDPDPLPGGKLGVWTNEQSIMVARVQVYYSKLVAPSPVVAPPPRRPDPPAAKSRLVVTGENRPGVFYDFESGTQGWESEVDGNARVQWDPTTHPRDGGNASLRIVNAEKPGRFVARIPWPPDRDPDKKGPPTVNLLACPLLRFDYCIPPSVRVNLYFDVGATKTQAGRTYFIVLTGPEAYTESIKRLGRFPGGKADGRWRVAEFDLARALRELYPTEAAVEARHFRFALEERGTYVAAGMAGNTPGAMYHIDNFTVACAAAGRPRISWSAAPDATGYATAVSDRHDTDPGAASTTAETQATLPAGKPGALRFFHVRPVAKSGDDAPVTRYPIVGAGERITIASIHPRDRATWGGGPIRIQLQDGQMPALKANTLALTVGGRKVTLEHDALSVDWERAVVTLDPSRLALEFKDRAVVDCSFRVGGVGQAGKGTTRAWAYVASLADDQTPPGRVRIARIVTDRRGREKTVPVPAVDDFEEHRRNWKPDDYTRCGLDARTAASGRRSLAIYNSEEGGAFQVVRSFHSRRILGRTPIIEFDYRASPELRTDFFVRGRGLFTFGMFDRSASYRVAKVPDVKADDQWHHARIDLFEPVWNSDPLALSSHLHQIGFGDYGWPSAREGDELHIDNVRLVSVLSSAGGQTLKVSAHDALGIAGFAHCWTAKADDEPPQKITSTDGVLVPAGVPDGRQWLHVRAVDRAGNWGPTEHVAFIIDNTPPEVARITPKDGQKICPGRFVVTVKDAYGPDPARLALTVDGRRYTLRSPSLRSSRRPTLYWDLSLTPEAIQPIPDGKKLAYTLEGVRDFAGNETKPVSGTWTMDHRRDRVPPPRVEFTLASAPVAFVQRYSQHTEHARQHRYVYVRHQLDRTIGSHVLEYQTRTAREQMVLLRHKPFDLAKTGLIKLDMKAGGQRMYLDLLLAGKDFKVKLRMGDPPPGQYAPTVGKADKDGYVYLGEMRGIQERVAERKKRRAKLPWVTLWADVGALVRKVLPKQEDLTVRRVAIGRMCEPFSHHGRIWFDNVMVYGYGKPELKATLQSRDQSGIAGYAVHVGKTAADKPKLKVNHTGGDELVRRLPKGTHVFTVMARDNNKNWSAAPGVLPYVVADDK
jgi:hypothetical protein